MISCRVLWHGYKNDVRSREGRWATIQGRQWSETCWREHALASAETAGRLWAGQREFEKCPPKPSGTTQGCTSTNAVAVFKLNKHTSRLLALKEAQKRDIFLEVLVRYSLSASIQRVSRVRKSAGIPHLPQNLRKLKASLELPEGTERLLTSTETLRDCWGAYPARSSLVHLTRALKERSTGETAILGPQQYCTWAIRVGNIKQQRCGLASYVIVNIYLEDCCGKSGGLLNQQTAAPVAPRDNMPAFSVRGQINLSLRGRDYWYTDVFIEVPLEGCTPQIIVSNNMNKLRMSVQMKDTE